MLCKSYKLSASYLRKDEHTIVAIHSKRKERFMNTGFTSGCLSYIFDSFFPFCLRAFFFSLHFIPSCVGASAVILYLVYSGECHLNSRVYSYRRQLRLYGSISYPTVDASTLVTAWCRGAKMKTTWTIDRA